MTNIRSILQQAGFTGSGLDTAQAVAMAESSGNSRALNSSSGSYGLFQIRMGGGLGASRMKQYGLSSYDDLYDPLTNAKIAYQMSNGGRDWQPWQAYTNGAYRTYLGNNTSVLAGAESPGVAHPTVAPRATQQQDLTTAFQGAVNQLGGNTQGTGALETIGLPTMSGPDFSSWIASLRAKVGPMTFQDISKPLDIPGLGGTTSDVSSGPWTDGSLMPSITGVSNGADPFGTSGGTPTAGGGAASGQAATIINWAKQFVGTPYVWGGNSLSSGVDCSGLVQQVFRHFGVDLPRLASQQANSGTRVSLNQMKPGDLVAWDDNPAQPGADHVAIYVGNGNILEAPRPGLSVRVRALGTWSADSQAFGVQILH